MSGQTFKVGDVCIGQYFVIDTECNGMECEILELAEYLDLRYLDGCTERCWAHFVKWVDGYEEYIPSYKLRRKPPKQSTDEWAESKVRELTKPVVQPEGVPA